MRRSANSRPKTSSRDRNDSTRLSESMTERQKKARASLRPLHRRNLAARLRLSSCARRQPNVRDHTPVPSTRSAMRKEVIAVVGTAPGRRADLHEPQGAPLLHQHLPQIEPARLGLDAAVRLRQHFRTYFITRTANTYSAMHYNIARAHEGLSFEQLDAAFQNPSHGTAPPGVQQRDHP